ncbi:MAG: right-handed parallel beta-helix repeat-containing protein [Nocardioides sp.]
MPVASLWRLLLFSVSVLVILAGMASTPVSARTADGPASRGGDDVRSRVEAVSTAARRADSGERAQRRACAKLDSAKRERRCKRHQDDKKGGKGGGKGGQGGTDGGTTPTVEPTPTPTATPTPIPTPTPAPSPTATLTSPPTPTPPPAPAAGATSTPTATATPVPSSTPTPSPTATPTPSATPSVDPTVPPTVEPTIPAPDPAPTAYYVDPLTGSDDASGTTATSAWRTLARASAATLAPGEVLRLRAGTSHVGALVVTESGTAADPVRVEAYGDGGAPVVSGGQCVLLQGDWLEVSGVHAADCGRAGFRVEGDDVLLEGVEASGSVAGVWIREGSQRATVAASYVHDNTLMAPDTHGPDDDYGAFGIEVNGDHARVLGNRISGHHAPSPDYRVDGAAVEVYQAVGTLIEGNTSTDDLAFTELGGSRTTGTRVLGNTVTSSAEEGTFLMTRGPGQVWGPVVDTVATGNTVRLTGAKSYGFGCYGACTPAHLVLSDNDIRAGWYVGWVDGTFTTTGNTYRGELWFPLGRGDSWLP